MNYMWYYCAALQTSSKRYKTMLLGRSMPVVYMSESSMYLGFVFVERHIESKSRWSRRKVARGQWREARCFTVLLDVRQSTSGRLDVSCTAGCGRRRRRNGWCGRSRQRRRRLWRCARCDTTGWCLLCGLLLLATSSSTIYTIPGSIYPIRIYTASQKKILLNSWRKLIISQYRTNRMGTKL